MSFPTPGSMPPGTPGSTPPPGTGSTPPGETPPGQPPANTKTAEELLADIAVKDAEIRRIAAESKARKEQLRALEQQQTEEAKRKEDEANKALAEQQKFKDLADKHAGRITELENTGKASQQVITDLRATVERYELVLKDAVKAQVKDVPAHLTALLDKLAPDEQLKWLAENRDKLLKKTPLDGVPPTPPQDGKGPTADQLKQAQETAARNLQGTL